MVRIHGPGMHVAPGDDVCQVECQRRVCSALSVVSKGEVIIQQESRTQCAADGKRRGWNIGEFVPAPNEMFCPVEDTINSRKICRSDLVMVAIVTVQFHEHTSRVPTFGIMKSCHRGTAPSRQPCSGQWLLPINARVTSGSKCHRIIGQHRFHSASRVIDRSQVSISRRGINRHLLMSLPSLQKDCACGVESGFPSRPVQIQADRPGKVVQSRLPRNPAEIIHRRYRRKRVSVTLEQSRLKPLVGIFRRGEARVDFQGKPGRENLSALWIHLLTVTRSSIRVSQSYEIGGDPLVPAISRGDVPLGLVGRPGFLKVVPHVQPRRRIPEPNHWNRMRTQRAYVTPVAIPETRNLGRSNMRIL